MHPFSSPPPTSFSYQRQELESANKKLKKDLNELRVSLTARKGSGSAPAINVLLEQLRSTTEELEMRKEEVLILRTQLVNLEGFKYKVWYINRDAFTCTAEVQRSYDFTAHLSDVFKQGDHGVMLWKCIHKVDFARSGPVAFFQLYN